MEWISVKRDKPELGVLVRVLVRRAGVTHETTATRTKNGAWILPNGVVGKVTHWLPLDAPKD